MLKPITNSPPAKKMRAMLFLLISAFLIAGCSQEGTAEGNVPIDHNEKAIEAVIEQEFNGPDKKFRQLWNAAMETQPADPNQEEYDAYTQSPVYKALTHYMEETYASYFTTNGYDNFIRSAPAFAYSFSEGDYQLSVSDIEIIQHAQESTFYTFTFQVNYENGETASFNFEGEAIVPKEGKIGKISFQDKDGLLQKLN